MPNDKARLLLQDEKLKQLQLQNPETGMGFYIAQTSGGNFYAVLSDGSALPLQADQTYFDLLDLSNGLPLPESKQYGTVALTSTFQSSAAAANALAALSISPHYTGGSGAFALVASEKLAKDTILYRYLRSTTDHRYSSGILSAHTYLTTPLDASYANSGFAAVGRFALPIPLPAWHVVHYELPAGTTIEIGTAMPLFGQAGGGVEIRLPASQTAKVIGTSAVPEF